MEAHPPGKERRRTLKSVILMLAALLAIGSITLWWCDHHIKAETSELVYDQVQAIPYNRVGVVLGTSEKGRGGGTNLYFTHRMKAASELYHAGKVQHLLLSGDNGRKGYNEPADMRRALIQAGVDSTNITLDYAGFRTFDSMVRAREVFGQDRFTVISQRFHNERAIYIAQQAGLQAIGFNAKDVTGRSGWRTALREKAARVKVFVDMALGIDPKFLGDPVELGTQPPPDPEN